MSMDGMHHATELPTLLEAASRLMNPGCWPERHLFWRWTLASCLQIAYKAKSRNDKAQSKLG
jgi:hypothetical protein